jgi:hypothetical protein
MKRARTIALVLLAVALLTARPYTRSRTRPRRAHVWGYVASGKTQTSKSPISSASTRSWSIARRP